MRGHHDYERAKDEHNALLGTLQMERFLAWLKTPSVKKAKVVFVVSPVPVVHWGPLVTTIEFPGAKDDLRDEREHESNTKERNKLLENVLEFSDNKGCPLVFISGDVHSASAYRIYKQGDYPSARVFNATSSAISRLPAPVILEHMTKKSGKISRYEGGYASQLYALSGAQNFLILSADNSGPELSVTLDMYRPEGNDGELVQKKIKLI